jgi:hypothetical protein
VEAVDISAAQDPIDLSDVVEPGDEAELIEAIEIMDKEGDEDLIR